MVDYLEQEEAKLLLQKALNIFRIDLQQLKSYPSDLDCLDIMSTELAQMLAAHLMKNYGNSHNPISEFRWRVSDCGGPGYYFNSFVNCNEFITLETFCTAIQLAKTMENNPLFLTDKQLVFLDFCLCNTKPRESYETNENTTNQVKDVNLSENYTNSPKEDIVYQELKALEQHYSV